MKTSRLRTNVKDFLKKGPKSTAEILDHINNTTRHGTTTQQLGNVLSKDKEIKQVGFVRRVGSKYGSYMIGEWALKAPEEIETKEERFERLKKEEVA